ncbi:Adaptive-response sensory-kinase SasA [Austwickia sp. TVS 96-490-7B]|uniref:sensor histidine kinase n=1 Tax=Austwickia sp. TVS 96-490-7B TaxID=2830843 RepID=UPI001C592987|nr:HAMP domain-containing sensor histidine kinase [Austwickia sp. TVS 96-490-7B]MBW3085000.1 Adaptive-response sensory-kinase SasA [Austwickia sp. TVS 96-490-7B]
MNPDLYPVTTAMSATLLVGLVGAALTIALSRRSVTVATVAAPLVAVLSVAAGVLMGTRTMLFDGARLKVLVSMIGATIPVALLVGVLLAARVHAVDRERARQESRRREAAEAERVRRDVVASVSHDLRTPLAGIRAMAEALEDGVATDPQDYLRRILRETERTSAMVDDLLALTSLHAGTTPTERSPLDVADLVSDSLASVGPAAAATGIDLNGYAEDGLWVHGDIRQLSRACLNLTVNAVQHTPPGGRVTVTARHLGDHIELAVEDGCGGIPGDDLTQVFSPGWRGSSARTPERGPFRSSGAGLGLAIVQAIVDGHHGHVTVTNIPSGCRFALRLPALPDQPSPHP